MRDLKLANQDGELYRLVLIAQCNALHTAMPFLFEHIADETELLLPDKLLLSDSVVAKLVAEIPEEDWAEVESIGWLYQFFACANSMDDHTKMADSSSMRHKPFEHCISVRAEHGTKLQRERRRARLAKATKPASIRA